MSTVCSRPDADWQWSGRCGWSRQVRKGVLVVHIAGVLDLSTEAALQELLAAALADRAEAVLLDLSDVEFIDCHSVGLIVAAWNSARGAGRSLSIDGVHGVAETLFTLCGLQQMLAIRPGDGAGGRDGDQ